MSLPSRLRALLLRAFLLLPFGSAAFAGAPAPAAKGYVCPPCDLPCDAKVYPGPGTCPSCGMKLVEAGSTPAEAPERTRVAILVFDGVELIDSMGPYEMFGAVGCEVFTVAATKAPVTSAMGLRIVPAHSFADAPQATVLVIPGGGVEGARHDEATLRYINAANARSEYTLSVCNGAFILAQTGLLDGLEVTTTRGNLRPLARQFPKLQVKPDQRYTDNGHILTTGGLSAGIDGALRVIEKLFGAEAARLVARGEEYHWVPGTALPADLAPAPPPAPHLAGEAGPVYACPMKEHVGEFKGPGECPECGMALVLKK